MSRNTVQFQRTFAAAHRVATDLGKCQRIHGHNYHVELSITSDTLDESNFVVPFDKVKAVIDRYDHRLILDKNDELEITQGGEAVPAAWVVRIAGVPSTERMAEVIADELVSVVVRATGAGYVSVWCAVQETDNIRAEVHREFSTP